MIGNLELVPMRRIEYRGVTFEEMDVDAMIGRHPEVAIVDELAHTNVPGSKNHKRFEDVMDLLDAGISVITAVNIQHLESLNDAVARTTGVRVRETVPDAFLRRADEVVNVDVSVDMLRTRLRQGKIYGVEKIEQSLNNFFRKGNLTALRELALRQLAEDQSAKHMITASAKGWNKQSSRKKLWFVWPLAAAPKTASRRVTDSWSPCLRLVCCLCRNAERRNGTHQSGRLCRASGKRSFCGDWAQKSLS